MAWSNRQSNATNVSNAGTTGVSLAFGSNVQINNVIVAWADYNSSASETYTFSDTQSNVTSWHLLANNGTGGGEGDSIAIAWGLATSTGACTPKWVNTNGTSAFCEIAIAEFVPPGTGASTDGVSGSQNGTGTTISPVCAGTVGTSDLLVAAVGGAGGVAPTLGGTWTSNTGFSFGAWSGYNLNVTGNTALNYTQGNGQFTSVICAMIAYGPLVSNAGPGWGFFVHV